MPLSRPSKSKWSTFFTWFTRDIQSRRGSQSSTCSELSTPSTPPPTFGRSKKRLFSNEKNLDIEPVYSHVFLRRLSKRTPNPIPDTPPPETGHLDDLFALALDEINYAEDSRGSPYYSGDRITAREAIEGYTHAYTDLLKHTADLTIRCLLESKTRPRIAQLQEKYDALPEDTH
ncbi:hypothetical protein J3Q64DRAFT_1751812 [Phycomyces blakesleeanus]|uniref:Uncharacterized protein n=2 Tax=Phycomyces blakesleeanus TaxID=4837 RepID=A0A162X681_PHYB8|nr:hypothetical protein PHYBLDRAFT_146086 [Phycomyces blakesleeanus NRRL 1555(-)]OAD72765.1 hypothetical protein PHYBLDRAFT_146086 [Phycomyces blakesleeanus NRRL 1555(-)]|eukprot:XP_018290805.1 hypothetical protein PHYBLDRAFT_146086 [Phycomyces blakesleeanus NRRL 1555(-)]